LQQLFAKYGNWFDTLAAYNWGPGKVDRALANGAPYPSGVNSYANGILENAQ
jgi:soluble lytic murein transglycosylase-like protein